MYYLSYGVLHISPLFPPSIIEIRLGGFGIWIFRIGYLGLILDLAYKICKNSCTYVFHWDIF